MPQLTGGNAFKKEMIKEALEEHDQGCCSFPEPCTVRTGLHAQLVRLELATKKDRPEPAPREHVTENPAECQYSPADLARRAATPATPSQINRIRNLCANLGTPFDEQAMTGCSMAVASKLISGLEEKLSERGTPVMRHVYRCAEDGLYVMDGEVYMVIKAIYGSGRPYAKKLTPMSEPRQLANGKIRTHAFTKATGAINKIRPEMRMTEEQAAHFGQLYGACVRCGMTLTREESKNRAMGSTCWSKTFGGK